VNDKFHVRLRSVPAAASAAGSAFRDGFPAACGADDIVSEKQAHLGADDKASPSSFQ